MQEMTSMPQISNLFLQLLQCCRGFLGSLHDKLFSCRFIYSSHLLLMAFPVLHGKSTIFFDWYMILKMSWSTWFVSSLRTMTLAVGWNQMSETAESESINQNNFIDEHLIWMLNLNNEFECEWLFLSTVTWPIINTCAHLSYQGIVCYLFCTLITHWCWEKIWHDFFSSWIYFYITKLAILTEVCRLFYIRCTVCRNTVWVIKQLQGFVRDFELFSCLCTC